MLLFVNAYCASLCATQAATDAGYSPKTATVQGSRLLRHPCVKAEIEKRSKGAFQKAELAADAALQRLSVTADNIIESLAEMGLAHRAVAKFLRVDTQGQLYYSFAGATPEELAAIQPMIQELVTEQYTEGRGDEKRDVIRSRVKFVERKGVLELLGRWNTLKMWSDKLELETLDIEKLSDAQLEALLARIEPRTGATNDSRR